ncbi:DUF262 domain-containing protein [Vibrio coralliilyticus]|uniref:DUF262 domain-containing protein n=1 Tax=Vibrio coralliilyticus TaxID=190893 RepID=UPI00148BF43D|nr:DUF262 domain-containing protein [Vibrio coralliilyticus]NOI27845.1 DUF262 domain-containing protein [Vibrio coralliilyticus]NOI50807.1 DUF262 domain-containing protein [Vibrio coralliilyticus]
MHFEEVLEYLEELVNVPLQPINDSGEKLVILDVDYDKKRYTIDRSESGATKKRTRAFSELNKIWSVLSQKGYTSVDQALAGAGSSRHQPETILANLPFIEHFKYDKKKHIYLRDKDTHELGTLKELSLSETREIKKRIDRYRDFDISQFYSAHNNQLSTLKQHLSYVFTKYPGESDIEAIKKAIAELGELETKLSEAVVTVDELPTASLGETSEEVLDDSNEDDEGNDSEEQGSTDTSHLKSAVKGLQSTRISQVTPTVSLVYDRVNYKEIDLQPEFQRGDRIWPTKDKARLIESVLLRLPLPVFYFAERPNDDVDADLDFDWIVIDGLQRITAFVEFMGGEFKLTGLKQLPQYNDLTFSKLPRREQRKIREYQIYGHLIQISEDSDEMIRELFHRINTYGKNLSYQEIRSALYPGSSNRFFKKFAEGSDFIDAIPAKVNSNRMLDIEYVLRATAYTLLGYEKYSYSTTDAFLSHAMQVLNKHSYNTEKPIQSSALVYQQLDYRFRAAFETITQIFGDAAYKKEEDGKVNKILFELLVSIFALMTDEQRSLITQEENSVEFKCKFFEAIENDTHTSNWISNTYSEQNRGFEYSITNSTSKKVTIHYRFTSVANMINKISGMNYKFVPLLESENKE